MSVKNKNNLKRFTYICLSLASIVFSSEIQAGSSFSKDYSSMEESADDKNSQRGLRRRNHDEGEGGASATFYQRSADLKNHFIHEEEERNRAIITITRDLIDLIFPKMKEETKKSLIDSIKYLFSC